MTKKIVLVTGGFDPLHSGHIEYFEAAKKLGDTLLVGVNSDEWLTRKKGRPFMPLDERAKIINSLDCVNGVIPVLNDNVVDDAGGAIFHILSTHGSDTEIIVANGGDRKKGNIPEEAHWGNNKNVTFVYGVGGTDKKNSSSWILDEWKTQKTEREWGHWRVLDDKQPRIGQKVKELVINPGQSLSDQRHKYRSEEWHVLEGEIQMDLEFDNGQSQIQILTEHTSHTIHPGTWHKVSNIGDKPAHIVEIQYGEKCVEEDIERRTI